MDNFESVNDILEFAISEEMAAWNFYNQMAKKARNPEIKKTFETFALEERQHQKKLEEIKEFAEAFSPEIVTDMKIAECLIPVEPTPDMNYQAAITYAMKKEATAMKLYTLLATMTTEPKLKAVFEALANEEAKHKLRFEKEYEEEILKED
ncbi:MAG: ferritin family protein [Planctomycetes bacterium]|nr:ferritin family protein [Planctomycetota bacterium]